MNTGKSGFQFLRGILNSRAAQLLTGPVLVIAAWYLVLQLHLLDSRLLPTPEATFSRLYESIVFGTMLHDIYRTLILVLYGFAIAAILGVPMGIALGSSDKIYVRMEFLIDFFRSLPATAIFPLFMMMFGITDFTKITIAAFSAYLIIIFNVAQGVLNARKTRILAAKSMGASRWRIFCDVIFYETLPQTFVGLRIAISMALVIIVVAEMFIGATDGLGHRIIDAQMGYDLTNMYASILMAGVLGYGLNYLFMLMEKRLIHWAGH